MFNLFKNSKIENIKEHFKDNPATYALTVLGVSKALLDNYWVFTSIPLGTGGTGAFEKFLYLFAQSIIDGGFGAAVGHGIDTVRSMRPGYQSI